MLFTVSSTVLMRETLPFAARRAGAPIFASVNCMLFLWDYGACCATGTLRRTALARRRPWQKMSTRRRRCLKIRVEEGDFPKVQRPDQLHSNIINPAERS